MKRNHSRRGFAIVLAAILALAPLYSTQAGLFRDWEDTEISQVKNQVTTAKSNAVEIVNKARAGFNRVTTDMHAMIEEAIADLQQQIQDEIAGRDAFLGSGGDCGAGTECSLFRGEIVRLFESMERLANTIFGLTPADVEFNFQRTISLLESAPGRALFPLYRALNDDNRVFGSGFVDMLDDLADNLLILDDGLSNGARGAGDSPIDSCQLVLDYAEQFSTAVTVVSASSGAVKLVGKGLTAAGHTGFDEADAGIHGYVHVTLKSNRKKTVGSFLDGIADFGLAFSSYASNKLRYCTVLQTREDMLREMGSLMSVLQGTDGSQDDQLDRILRNQMEILDRIDDIGPPWGNANGHRRGVAQR